MGWANRCFGQKWSTFSRLRSSKVLVVPQTSTLMIRVECRLTDLLRVLHRFTVRYKCLYSLQEFDLCSASPFWLTCYSLSPVVPLRRSTAWKDILETEACTMIMQCIWLLLMRWLGLECVHTEQAVGCTSREIGAGLLTIVNAPSWRVLAASS